MEYSKYLELGKDIVKELQIKMTLIMPRIYLELPTFELERCPFLSNRENEASGRCYIITYKLFLGKCRFLCNVHSST